MITGEHKQMSKHKHHSSPEHSVRLESNKQNVYVGYIKDMMLLHMYRNKYCVCVYFVEVTFVHC